MSISPEKFIRFGRSWGDNKVFNNGLMNALENNDWDYSVQALGHSEACPVVERLIDSRGPEAMAKRYAQVMFWRKEIAEKLYQNGRPDLATDLKVLHERLDGEPVGDKYDSEWIPSAHMTHIAGPGTHAGYALPRIAVEFISDLDAEKQNSKIDTAHDLLIEATKEAATQDDSLEGFLIRFANKLANVSEKEPTVFLKHILSQGKLEEDNCHTGFQQILNAMTKTKGPLYDTYTNLSAEKLTDLRIANIS